MENLEQEKSLELAGASLSDINKVENDSTIENIITQDTFVGQEEYDPFDISDNDIEIEEPIIEKNQDDLELTEWEKLYQEMDLILEDDKEYDSEVTEIKIRNEILNVMFKTYTNGFTKVVQNSYFFSSKECTQYAFRLIREFAKMLGLEMNKSNFKDIETIAKTLNTLIGKKVSLVPKTRIDEKNGKSYQNYDVVKVLEDDYVLGGNL